MSGFRQQIWGFFRELKSDPSEEIAAVEYSGDVWAMAGLNKLVKGLGCPWAMWLWLCIDQSKAETHSFSWATWWRACLHQLSPQTAIILLPIAVGWMMSPVRTHLRSVTGDFEVQDSELSGREFSSVSWRLCMRMWRKKTHRTQCLTVNAKIPAR